MMMMMMMMMKYEDEHEDNQAGSMMVRMMKIESPGSYQDNSEKVKSFNCYDKTVD